MICPASTSALASSAVVCGVTGTRRPAAMSSIAFLSRAGRADRDRRANRGAPHGATQPRGRGGVEGGAGVNKREREAIRKVLEENPYARVFGSGEQSIAQVLKLALYQAYKAGRIHGWRERDEKAQQEAAGGPA